jgi:tetratricopeptide (TPR) repeat protein
MSRLPSTTSVPGARSSATSWPALAVAAILTLAALAAYWNSFTVPFLLDDASSIGDNPSIRDLGKLADVLSPPATGTTAARPLLNFTLAVNYAWGGLSVRGYHAINLFIHVCAGLALFGIVRRTLILPPLSKRYGAAALPLAAFAALLWTLHPLQTESVTYLSQRAESLMGLFFLLTLYGFIRSVRSYSTEVNEGNEASGTGHGSLLSPLPSVKTPGSKLGGSANQSWLILSVAACFCGMATKQVMVTAPVLVLLYDRALVSGSFRSALVNRRWYYASLATTWILLGFLMCRSPLASINAGFHAGVSWRLYGLTELQVVTDYLRLALWPHPLAFDYGSEILVTDPWAVAPYAVIVSAGMIAVIVAWRRSPMAGFLGIWLLLILAPTSTVVPIADQPMAESRMYLPLAAVVVLVTLLGYALGQRRAFVVLGLAAAALGALTSLRNHEYRSELSIWEDTVNRCPHSSRAYCSLGQALAQLPGRLPEAIARYEEALRLQPAYAKAHHNLALALVKMPGRLPDAIAHYEEALRLQPDLAETHYNLANILSRTPGRLAEAIAHYETALRLKPDLAEAHINLANVLSERPGRLADALAHYEAALRLTPDSFEAHFNLATELVKIPGRLNDATTHFEAAVQLKPGLVEARLALAAIYARTGRADAAIDQLEIAARLDPTSMAIRENLEKLRAARRK